MAPPNIYKWFFETTTPVEGHFHAITRQLFSLQTRFQQMEILETAHYGKALVLDGRLQSTVADDFIYHESLVHPALILHPGPRTALVIGGGEGATLREVLRHRSVGKAVMVDIDQAVVEACRQHLPEMHANAFADPRTELRHEDARGYLQTTAERFDVAIVDLTEPLEEGPACLLFTREFYRLLADRLTPNGVLAMQAGMTKIGELGFYAAMARTLSEVFPVVAPYQSFVPCFGTPWGFIVAAKVDDPRTLAPAAVDGRVRERVAGELRFYDGLAHQHLFSLPKFLRHALASCDRVATDAEPLLVR
ncbi:MAG TPA: polyamine aminopropyltransferase [Methylomirabilota bacterium]|jgi:spermidine synthase|nr:polyamine aminopropyltransferase [Methylomirabilota bacterium]